MELCRYKIYEPNEEVLPPFEAARELPDGKIIGKYWIADHKTIEKDSISEKELTEFLKQYETQEND